jgi:probable rRNA maturation factor
VNIRIKNTQKKQRLATTALGTKLGNVLRSIGLRNAELSILFVGDRAMRTLNRRYRGMDRTTDVLSFSLREGAFSHVQPEVLGDIVIAVPTAARQAVEAGHTLGREIEVLLVHGLLHLLGYDHERSEAEERRMKRREVQFLKRLSA